MLKSNTESLTLKEIETDFFRMLQQTYSEIFQEFLTELDQEIAEERDKARFQLKDKRAMTMDSLFGSIEVSRNYYYDRKNKKYMFLLDQHLQFEGAKGLSPLVQEMAVELAVEGQSYRSASHTLEKLKSSAGEAVRDNVSYLQQATGKPVYRTLKGLQGF